MRKYKIVDVVNIIRFRKITDGMLQIGRTSITIEKTMRLKDKDCSLPSYCKKCEKSK